MNQHPYIKARIDKARSKRATGVEAVELLKETIRQSDKRASKIMNNKLERNLYKVNVI